MKTHELADQLELLARLLRSLPDAELEETIAKSLSLLGNSTQVSQSSSRSMQSLPKGMQERLKKMTPAEIEKYLGSEVEPFSTAQLQDIALCLGITASKRQSKSALINLIARHFEASQMDSIIRPSRREES